ncbi:MAG: hypothetical protein P1V36_18080, partial [Planctomycetota bacterium]|nr:hypothetical protein [Planctomycetota bacterium]
MRLPPRPYPTLVALTALFLLAFLMRTPLLGLPLEGESARLAGAADRLADGEGAWCRGQAPLVPALVAGLSRGFGVRPTPALRWLDALAAAALAPLAWALALALR